MHMYFELCEAAPSKTRWIDTIVQKSLFLSVRLELKLKGSISSTATTIVYAECESLVEIDRQRNVTIDSYDVHPKNA